MTKRRSKRTATRERPREKGRERGGEETRRADRTGKRPVERESLAVQGQRIQSLLLPVLIPTISCDFLSLFSANERHSHKLATSLCPFIHPLLTHTSEKKTHTRMSHRRVDIFTLFSCDFCEQEGISMKLDCK